MNPKKIPLLKILRLVATFVLSLLWTLTASARLGENEKELTTRFGEPGMRSQHSIFAQGKIVHLGPALFFKQDDWLIQADLVDGVCVRIHYSKPGDWTGEQFKTVLDANAQGASWTEKSKPQTTKFLREWQRGDGGSAVWKRADKFLLGSPAYTKAVEKAQAEAKVNASRKPNI